MSETVNFLELLRRNGHVADPQTRLTPLSGGVSSEIYLVEDGARQFIVKRALPKLKVKDNWYADISRNASERDYLAYVGQMIPGAVPQLYFSSPSDGYFAMEYLGGGFLNWKSILLDGDFRIRHAERAGNILGEIHRRTMGADEARIKFDTTATFHQLRVEPYLLTTGERHPALRAFCYAEAARLEATHEALVHGDFSPKNIMFCDDRMVLLDCEVAWYGDPAFDVVFLLNHLFLKSLHHAPKGAELLNMVDVFWREYSRQLSTLEAARIEIRLVPLLLMMMLARVDGKSPVEYLAPSRQQFIRAFVYKHLVSSQERLSEFCAVWFSELNTLTSIEVHQ